MTITCDEYGEQKLLWWDRRTQKGGLESASWCLCSHISPDTSKDQTDPGPKMLLPADNIKLGPYVATNVANVWAMAQVSASLWSKIIWPTCISGSPAFCSPTSVILARSASISRWYLRLNRSSSWDTPSAPLELPVCLADPSRLGWSSSSLSRYLLRRWLYIYRMCVLVLIWCRERMDYRMVPVRLGDWQSFKSCISWL